MSPPSTISNSKIRHIQKRPGHSRQQFLLQTISAQLHLVGFLAAFVGLAVLLTASWEKIEPEHFWTCLIFGSTSLLVFGISSIYHFLSDGYLISNKLQNIMEDLDHSAIYLFIAGSYTPFILNALTPPWSKILMIGIWVVAIAGISYTLLKPGLPAWARHRYISTGLFILMGWTLVVRLEEALNNIGAFGAYLLIAGGISYTVGAIVYAIKWPDPIRDIFGFHEIWHIFVLAGFSFHYFLILNFYLRL